MSTLHGGKIRLGEDVLEALLDVSVTKSLRYVIVAVQGEGTYEGPEFRVWRAAPRDEAVAVSVAARQDARRASLSPNSFAHARPCALTRLGPGMDPRGDLCRGHPCRGQWVAPEP